MQCFWCGFNIKVGQVYKSTDGKLLHIECVKRRSNAKEVYNLNRVFLR